MNWDSLKEAIYDVFDETISGIDPDETLQRLIIRRLEKRLMEEVEIELSLLDDEYERITGKYKNILEDLTSDRSADA